MNKRNFTSGSKGTVTSRNRRTSDIPNSIVEVFATVGARLAASNLISGRSGNISIRTTDRQGLIITTRGADCAKLSAETLVAIVPDGKVLEGQGQPSTELALHRAIYRARADVGAIIHTHSIFATVIAARHSEILPFLDELVHAIGGSVATATYGYPGSEELARNAVAALKDKQAVLLATHGAVGVGSDLDEALSVCETVERAAWILVYARLLGGPFELDPKVVARQKAIFRRRQNKR